MKSIDWNQWFNREFIFFGTTVLFYVWDPGHLWWPRIAALVFLTIINTIWAFATRKK